ncbi:MAG: hypothetical protein H3C63_17410 [Candidatus Omnitrophica bacterium]|nr:hypothetical protein [Candidatus Omnitrophota bacterium]
MIFNQERRGILHPRSQAPEKIEFFLWMLLLFHDLFQAVQQEENLITTLDQFLALGLVWGGRSGPAHQLQVSRDIHEEVAGFMGDPGDDFMQ